MTAEVKKSNADAIMTGKATAPLFVKKEWVDDGQICATVVFTLGAKVVEADLWWIDDHRSDLKEFLLAQDSVKGANKLLGTLRTFEPEESERRGYLWFSRRQTVDSPALVERRSLRSKGWG